MRVSWTRAALRHLDEIQDHIAQESPAAAYRLAVDLTERTTRLLADHPMMGRPGRARGTREFVLGGTAYIVVYRVSDDDIAILAVVHGARDWPASLDQL